MTSKQKLVLLISVALLLIVGLAFSIYQKNTQPKTENNLLILNSYDSDGDNAKAADKDIAGTNTLAKLPQTARWRAVNLNPKITKYNDLAHGDTLQLNLFADANYTAKIDRISKNVNDTTTIRGRIENNPLSYVLISTTGDQSLIEVEIPEKNQQFVIQSDSSGGNYLIDRSTMTADELIDQPALIPPTESEPVAKDIVPASDPLDVTIDVMIIYTTAARVWADASGGGIDNIIADALARGQLVNDNSGTALTLRLVHSVESNYEESGNSGTDLDRLTNPSDGYMDNVSTLRDQYGADLVTLLANVEDTGGIAWLLNNPSGLPNYAFSLVRVKQAGWTYTLVHELGHNLGNGHSKIQNFQAGPGLFSYSAGWRWIGTNNGKYCSVMTYEAGAYYADGQTHTAVAHWSNPSITYEGVATGNDNDSDNARSIREIKDVVNAYRNEITYPTISIGAPSAESTTSGPVSYTITYGDANDITLANDDITLNKMGTADGTVTVTGSGLEERTVTISDITGNGTLGISIAAGTATDIDDNTAPAVGPSATFDVGVPLLYLSSSNFSNGWNMTSFPDLSAAVTSSTLLPGNYKIRRYDGASNSYIKGEDGDITLTPGAGYWIRADDNNSITGQSYILNQVSSTEIATTFGWNLLGNPYQSNLPLSNLRVKYQNGSTQSYEEALNAKKVSGYGWSWEKSADQYYFVAINPNNYSTSATKRTYISPFRGFWMIVKSNDVSSIIISR
jgi:hypothetical protein